MSKLTLKQRLRNWLMYDDVDSNMIEPARIRESDSPEGNPMRMHVYPASGGTVIETRTYDSIKDRHNTNLYVIHSDADMGEEIAKIITFTSIGR